MRSILLSMVLFCLSGIHSLAQQITFQPANVVFTTPVFTTKTDSATITVQNSGCRYMKVLYARCQSSVFICVDSTGFIMAPNTSRNIKIRFAPRQNIEYNAALLVHTTQGDYSLPLKGYGRFTESYYDNTYNKFDEALKSSLNTLLGTNYQSYSYNAARDKMFMEIDNKKTNGQNASQNTLECIYTGRLAVGYTSRTDCQTNDNFNTEHTWPQSLFSSSLPMVSDLNHLFPTDDAANNYRGNNPFGMVSSPSWSVGGSKGIPTLFEPRDAQKGRTARAMLYFAIRYNNPSYGLVTFFGPQETILRTWCMQFMPDSIDIRRNNAIYAFQNNRNPFIDHPEFLERITSIANTSVAQVLRSLVCDTTPVDATVYRNDTFIYPVAFYNAGNNSISCSKIATTSGVFSVSSTGSTVPALATLTITLNLKFRTAGDVYDTLIVENNSTNKAVIRIPIHVRCIPLSVNSPLDKLCGPVSATLTGNSGGSITWSTGAVTPQIIVSQAGSYSYSFNDSNGCHQSDTLVLKSYAAVTISKITIAGDSLKVTAIAPVTWYRNDTVTGTGNAIRWNLPGYYRARAIDPSSLCEANSDTLKMERSGIAVQLVPLHSITPNPFTDRLEINAEDAGEFRVINSLGQVILVVETTAGVPVTLNTQMWPSGMYIVSGTSGGMVRVIKP